VLAQEQVPEQVLAQVWALVLVPVLVPAVELSAARHIPSPELPSQNQSIRSDLTS
jgi:hypothetical protein